MHRLLGAVHEAAVQLSELPIGYVPTALLQVLHSMKQNCLSDPSSEASGLPSSRQPEEALTVSRSRRKRMLGTR